MNPHEDCFAYQEKKCMCLTKMLCKDPYRKDDCPFYKRKGSKGDHVTKDYEIYGRY